MGPDRSLAEQLQSALGLPPEAAPRPGPRELQAKVLRPIVQRLNAAEAHAVLELGCGSGWFTSAMERCGFDVTGIDHDEASLEAMHRHFPELRIVRHEAGRPLPPAMTRQFDAAIVIAAPGARQALDRWVEAGATALKPGSTLMVADQAAARSGWPWRGALRRPAQPAPLLRSPEQLRALLEGFGLRDVKVDLLGRFPKLSRALLACGRIAG